MSASVESKKLVKVKFNFPMANPKYDFTKALRIAKEEKSWIAYNTQLNIDLAMNDSVFHAGSIYEISSDLFEKLSERTVETYNPLFGAFQGQALEMIKRPKIPFVLKVDSKGELLDPHQEKLDLYPINKRIN